MSSVYHVSPGSWMLHYCLYWEWYNHYALHMLSSCIVYRIQSRDKIWNKIIIFYLHIIKFSYCFISLSSAKPGSNMHWGQLHKFCFFISICFGPNPQVDCISLDNFFLLFYILIFNCFFLPSLNLRIQDWQFHKFLTSIVTPFLCCWWFILSKFI